ncbi:MAG: hypothetical protein K6C10_01150 [Prevotella sp.]|nr:hypothetical protein [Prevotella sp.]
MLAKNQAIEQLRIAVEQTFGMKLQSNKDFEDLSDSIFNKTHAKVSTTTLKRIWGYISENVSPRRYTLDQLSRYVGYADFETFCNSLEMDKEPESGNSNSGVGTGFTPRPQEDSELQKNPKGFPTSLPFRGRLGRGFGVGILVVTALTLLFFLLRPTTDNSADNNRVLKKGQVFASYNDFLPLFGINATESRHYQYVPGEEHIIVWSPQYHNPYYHNDGNPDSLMPTITEYLTLKVNVGENAEAMKEKMRQEHKKAYSTALEKNDVRIVFMKDLVDTSFVFLGVYRFSILLSDSTKVVWVRATNECDLDNISFLSNYRN